MIIAIDYDNTIALESRLADYGQTGSEIPNIPLINKLIEYRKKGHKLILWTCRGGEWLIEAIEFCKYYGLEFDAINENILGIHYKNVSCKVVADLYIDDKNMLIDDFIKD